MSILFLFILGASIGSFINVIRMRLETGSSFIQGRSHCDSCAHVLSPVDLVPLASYALLGGKCRYCNNPIPQRHFWIELAGGILFLLGIHGRVFDFFIQVLLHSLLLYATITDIDTLSISDANLIGILFCKILIFSVQTANFQVGSLIPWLIFSLGILLFACFFSKAFGMGDALLLSALSFGMTAYDLIRFLLFSIWSGGAFALFLLLKGADRKTAIPFVPFIVLGYLLVSIL